MVGLVLVIEKNMRNDFKAVASDFIEVDPYHYPNETGGIWDDFCD